MALSDCAKCWNTPCSCGWEYRFQSRGARMLLASVILGMDVNRLDVLIRDSVPKVHPMRTLEPNETEQE